jgi:hypothetical protein
MNRRLRWAAARLVPTLALLTLACGVADPDDEALLEDEIGTVTRGVTHGWNVYFGNTHCHTWYSDGYFNKTRRGPPITRKMTRDTTSTTSLTSTGRAGSRSR